MKIIFSQENLQKVINYLSKAIPAKPQLPSLSSIHVEIQNNQVIFSATDLYFGVRASLSIPLEIKKSQSFIVPGKQFREIISSLPIGKVEVDFEESVVKIKSGSIKASLQCQSADEYPTFPQSDGVEYKLDNKDLDLIDQKLVFSASLDQTRPILTTLFFDFEEKKLKVVATDGFRLAVLKLEIDSKSMKQEGVKSFMIPARFFSEVVKIIGQTNAQQAVFRVSDELKQAFFIANGVEIYVRLIDGEYPPYEKIIPSVFTTEVEFDRDELLDNVKRATIFSRDSSNIIKLNLLKEKITLSATSSVIGDFSADFQNVEIKGDGGEIAFNAKYLLDYLQSVDSEKVWFGMSESLKPALFKTSDLDNYQYIVMPFKINS